MERTLVILKPDAVKRAILGEIIQRFEKVGLKIIGMKMIVPSKDLLKKHYPDALVPVIGNKTKKDWSAYNIEHTESAEEIGQIILDATREFMGSGPVIAMVLEGGHAVEITRKLVGVTGPKDSPAGTIRGDFAHMSLGDASTKRRGAANLLHASGSVDEANAEIELWFKPEELYDYQTVHEQFTHA